MTWRRGDAENGILRGCKGCTAGPKPLPEQLRRYAILSGTQDTRFDPITRQEVSELSCHVSILHSFETVEHYNDWIVGVHGVTIDFEVYDHPVNGKHSSSNPGKPTFEGHAIFLPGVAPSNSNISFIMLSLVPIITTHTLVGGLVVCSKYSLFSWIVLCCRLGSRDNYHSTHT